MSASPGPVFELVDCTDEETYYTMGIFLTLQDALDQVKDCDQPPTDAAEDFARLEVRERKIGKLNWSGTGEKVAEVTWVHDYIESRDEWVWHKPSISLPNAQGEARR